jgi:hypothetical protein
MIFPELLRPFTIPVTSLRQGLRYVHWNFSFNDTTNTHFHRIHFGSLQDLSAMGTTPGILGKTVYTNFIPLLLHAVSCFHACADVRCVYIPVPVALVVTR